MATSPEVIQNIDKQIVRCSSTICRHIDQLDISGRGAVSQDILAHLRTFVEHIMLKIYSYAHDTIFDYQHITLAVKFIKTKGQLRFLWRFHSYLQIVASHYSLEPEDSERVLLKYYEFLLKVRKFLKSKYSMSVLENLEKFPLNTDKILQNYYEKIAERFANRNHKTDMTNSVYNRYYILKVKPFFIKQRIYYEVTFIPAIDNASKTNRIIGFTTLDVSKYYAVKLWTIEDSIDILGKTMPIFIITKWEVAIRPIEIEKFSNIFCESRKGYANSAESRGLMRFLTTSGFNLVEILDFEDSYYQKIRRSILAIFNAKASHLFELFDRSRNIIRSNVAGTNTLRYLLYHMNNRVITDQLDERNDNLSGLCLSYGCLPFEEMPFCTSLKNHNPRLTDLFDCIDPANRSHEILAHYIQVNTMNKGQLYTPRAALEQFGNVDALVAIYNNLLYYKHQARQIAFRYDYFYIRSYESDTVEIIKKLIELSSNGLQNYTNSVDGWLASGVHTVDCEEKRTALRQMFSQSSVAIIYGSAGTGKSTLIDHISNFFKNQSKLYLANTNPAVDNMKRRVSLQNADTMFMTITKFCRTYRNRTNYDILIIDECSTVSNRDMVEIMNKAQFDLLILVGDIYQIEAISFGNWFSAAKGFLPTSSVYELKIPYRSNNAELKLFWDRVRNMDDRIEETIARNQYASTLDDSLFLPAEKDEITLCLNYDGLYGINNINRFLQEANPNPSFTWGLQQFKVADPVLFNETDRFAPLIYNNVKGWIAAIRFFGNRMEFDIEVDLQINGLDARNYDFELLDSSTPEKSVIRFSVDNSSTTDENYEIPSSSLVPFQVAYAVSIHKAQGLEFNSVKVVITDDVEDHITHSILYTAITRARNKLKIYWSPEVGHKILSTISPKDNNRDISIIRQIIEAN